MKYANILFLAGAALALTFSCKEPVDLGPENVAIDTESSITIPAEGGSVTVGLTATVDWAMQGYTEDVQSWLSIEPSSGKAAAGVQTVTITALPNEGYDRTADLVFYGNVMCKAPLTITQPGLGGDGEQISIAEFIEAGDTGTEHVLTGVIGNISRRSNYWGFILKDDTGTISCPFVTDFTTDYTMLHTGDQVSIRGSYSFFVDRQEHRLSNGTIESYTCTSTEDIESVTVAEFNERADMFSLYRLTGTISTSVNSTYCSFDITDETGSVYVYSVNNASEYGSVLKQGDKVTLRGAWYEYNGTNEVVDATIESYEAGTGDGGDDPVTGDAIYSNTFLSSIGDFTINNVSIPSALEAVWTQSTLYGMVGTAYANDTNYDAESWLISPVIDLSSETKAYLTFEHATNFFSSVSILPEQATVWAREADGEWTKLTGVKYPESLSWSYVNAGYLDLSAYVGKSMQFAFVYKSTSEKAGTWEVKNVAVVRESQSVDTPDIPEGAIEINLGSNYQTWSEATDATYGAGYETTVDGILMGYYRYGNNNAARAADADHIRVYKGSAFRVKSDKTITQIHLYCTASNYCADLSPLEGGGTYSTNSATYVITWTGSATEVVAQAGAQVRFNKIVIVCE